MANFDVYAWESLPLVRRLNKCDSNAWQDMKKVINEVTPLLCWRPFGLEEYTDHDINHCFRIAQALGNIIPSEFDLTKYELEFLLYSILFHDLGMWTKKCETEAALRDQAFVDYLEKTSEYDSIVAFVNSGVKEEKYYGNFMLRTVVARYHRSIHASRVGKLLLEDDFGFTEIKRIPDEYLKIISIICGAHDWNSEEVLKSDLLDEIRLIPDDYSYENEDELMVDVRLLSFLLRIGDLLDLDCRRISRQLWNYVDKMSVEAEAHWRKHECMRFKKLNRNEIIIVGNYNYDRYGQVAAEAFHLAKQWCSCLTDEINLLQKALRSPARYSMKANRKLGDLYVDAQGIKGTGIIFADNLSFDMNKSRIIEILGDEIYEDKSSFIRELIQNAIDATRTQIVDDYQNGKLHTTHTLDLRSPNSWPREITKRDCYAITISAGVSQKKDATGKRMMYFEVSDQGIGMTVDQIKKYFLQIGKSYYKSNDFRTKYAHSSISRFGIGFLSCLLIGSYIEVETMSRDGSNSLKLVMDNNTDVVSIVTGDRESYGTTVRVFFDPDIVADTGWLPVKELDKDLMKYIHPDMLNSEKLQQAVYYWVPWNEISIILNGRLLVPRSPDEIKSNEKFWFMPYRVYAAEDNEILAAGSLVFEKATIIPRFDNRDHLEDHFLPSIGGIIIPPWKRMSQAAAYIDIYRQPESIITASRRAKFEVPSCSVKKSIIQQTIKKLDQEYQKRSVIHGQLLHALFRSSICIEVDNLDLLLPVIRNGKMNWEYWDKKRFGSEACALVPFFIPLEQPDIKYPVPIVGVPRRKRNSPRDILPKIDKLRAVSINDKFTAALSSPLYSFVADELKEKYTFMMYRLVTYDTRKEEWKTVNEDMASQEPIRQQMPDWDRTSGNIWKTYGFDPLNTSQGWHMAHKHLGSDANLNVEVDMINIQVPRRDWNKLEKPNDIDPMIKLLLSVWGEDD